MQSRSSKLCMQTAAKAKITDALTVVDQHLSSTTFLASFYFAASVPSSFTAKLFTGCCLGRWSFQLHTCAKEIVPAAWPSHDQHIKTCTVSLSAICTAGGEPTESSRHTAGHHALQCPCALDWQAAATAVTKSHALVQDLYHSAKHSTSHR